MGTFVCECREFGDHEDIIGVIPYGSLFEGEFPLVIERSAISMASIIVMIKSNISHFFHFRDLIFPTVSLNSSTLSN